MPEFIRANAPGGTFFITLVTHQRRRIFDDPVARRLLREAIEREIRPFAIDAMVLLPDHMHCLMTLPERDDDFSTRCRKIKEGFTRAYLAVGRDEGQVTVGQSRKGLRGIWQQRFWEHTIRDDRDFEMHADYIHFNPVKHGHASCAHAWPWSTFRQWVRRGAYEMDWCCACNERKIRPPSEFGLDETAME